MENCFYRGQTGCKTRNAESATPGPSSRLDDVRQFTRSLGVPDPRGESVEAESEGGASVLTLAPKSDLRGGTQRRRALGSPPATMPEGGFAAWRCTVMKFPPSFGIVGRFTVGLIVL